jgi:hypothetical protein
MDLTAKARRTQRRTQESFFTCRKDPAGEKANRFLARTWRLGGLRQRVLFN